ncbi:MAG: helix-turn-helix domain-containing protein [Ruminococcaceae bacterium]|nr:helix-turn-helix domain-containing protein [Oscillospiraceae bacterium]
MAFGEQLRHRRTELGLSRSDLAAQLGVSPSAIGNYETGISTPREDVLLQMFDALQVDPNYLYRGSFRPGDGALSDEERNLLEKYRQLGVTGRQAAQTMLGALGLMQEEAAKDRPAETARVIPLYSCPAAAGYAAPVFGEDYQLIQVTGEIPAGAELAVRIQGDSMEPYIEDGSVVYVNHDPLVAGDVGIFCVDGDMLCKQYYKDPLGMVYLFSLNRKRADADVVLPWDSGRSLTCFGRVILHTLPLPE